LYVLISHAPALALLPYRHINAHYIFHTLNRDSTILLRVEFRYSSPNYQACAAATDDGWGWIQNAWVTIGDAPHLLGPDWQAASAAWVNDGMLAFRVYGAQ
jgi:hypothetical protein